MIMALGSLRPCCPSDQGLFSSIFSDTCDYCSDATREANLTLMQNPNNQGNESEIPNCDPNAGYFSNLFSNSCNVTVNSAINQAVGLPNVPAWVWWLGGGILALGFIKRR